MSDIDAYELELLKAFESGHLKSIASKSELAKFKAAARASAIKDKRVNIRLSSVDLTDIQVKAMEEGVLQALQDIAVGAGLDWATVASTLKKEGRLQLETY